MTKRNADDDTNLAPAATPELEEIAAHLSVLSERTQASAAELAALTDQLLAVRARGTRDVPAGKIPAIDGRVATTPDRGPWFVGDRGPTPELIGAIAGACTDRPMTHAELVTATGARPGRISGCLVEMRRARMPLVNLGSGNKARYWFVTPDAATRATGGEGS